MRGQAPISPIYRMAGAEDQRDPMEQWGRLEMMRRRCWQQKGVVAVHPDQLPSPLKEMLTEWAEAEYGKR